MLCQIKREESCVNGGGVNLHIHTVDFLKVEKSVCLLYYVGRFLVI